MRAFSVVNDPETGFNARSRELKTRSTMWRELSISPYRAGPGSYRTSPGQGLTLVYFAAQPEPFLTQITQITP
jgi:hypothetical protein